MKGGNGQKMLSIPGVVGGVVGVAVEGGGCLGHQPLGEQLDVLLVGDAAGEQDPGLGRVAPRAARPLAPHNVRDLADDLVLLVLDAGAVQVHLDK